MSDAILEVRNLKKYFNTPAGALHAVDDVSFTIEKGKTLGVVGESGCGKSTLGRTVLRLLPVTDGQVIYKGRDISRLSERQMKPLRGNMQIIFQDPYSSLNPRMSLKQIIAEPMIVNKICKSGPELDKRVRKLMDTVGLSQRLIDTYPHELDGGRRQRIGVARALALEPDFIVCDEPVSALDVSIQAQILNLLMDLQDDLGIAYMFITHDLSVVRHISDDIMVMYMGNCLETAPSDELFKNPVHPYTKALLSAVFLPEAGCVGDIPEVIRGEVTSPINPKPGCRFAPRCNYACEACKAKQELKEISPGHFVACCTVGANGEIGS